MSTKSDYSPTEWELLLEVPPLVGTAVMVAGRSGVGGTMKESLAIAAGVLEACEDYQSNELVQSLITARTEHKERAKVEQITNNPYLGKPSEEIKAIAVDKCRQVAALLEEKATSASEAREFKEWAVHVAERVANAAKEGSFLGIGGERVSPSEISVIAAVKDALAV